ncbi:hypothetical protein L1049_024433 [Liquidambar formosana]|uniref:F-box associated beta-propeller type 1 domain-containing protein n=1 Tax=Liquidambar formosana TaxID=63359 RepID=A0AAP0S1I8_LIQFO
MEENPNNKSLRRRRSTTATRRATTSCDVPWDIIINILSWLPVKSLMRFSSIKPVPITRAMCSVSNNIVVSTTSLYVVAKHLWSKRDWNLHSRAQLGFSGGKGIVMGCFVSLVLIPRIISAIYFCGTPPFESSRSFRIRFRLTNFLLASILDLALSLRLMDYKVIKFIFPRKWNGPRILPRGSNWLQVPPRVEMYSLKTNSWKDIQNVAPCMTIWFCNKSPVVNGVVLWLAGKKNEESHSNEFILSFDMANEVFSEIKLPECFHDVLVHDMYGMVESLSLFVYSKEKCREEIWVMKKYGAAESWSKQYTFEWMDFALPFLGSLKNGELVVKDDHDGKLIFYDPRVQQVKDVRIHGIRGSLCVFTCYMESLVLLNEGN